MNVRVETFPYLTVNIEVTPEIIVSDVASVTIETFLFFSVLIETSLGGLPGGIPVPIPDDEGAYTVIWWWA